MGINLSEVSFAYYVPKSRKQTVEFTLKNINLNINSQDEFIALVGHTGSGKSTLVQLFNALLFPTSGVIIIDDNNKKYNITKNFPKDEQSRKYRKVLASSFKPRFKLHPIRKHTGLVFQFPEYQIFEETVLKDISFGPKNFHHNPETIKEKVEEIANLMGITDLLDKSPFALSGGQMRKVAIAGILASDPDILVLDEPTVGLDPLAKKDLLNLLEKLNKEFHKSIIIITHDMDVVAEYAKRVIVLRHGVLEYDGPKTELFQKQDIIEKCHLGYPTIMTLLRDLNNKLNLGLNEYQYNIDEAFLEIKKKAGEENE